MLLTSYRVPPPGWRFTLGMLCLLAMSSVQLTHAQSQTRSTARFTHFGPDQGLNAGTIFSILEDRMGFIWLGTRYGLQRYDGYTFKRYDDLGGDTLRVLNSPIFGLCEDNNGRIWSALHGGGLAALDPRTGEIRYYKNDPTDRTSLSAESIVFLCADEEGKVIAVSQNWDVNVYELRRDRFISYRPSPLPRPMPSVAASISMPVKNGRIELYAFDAHYRFDLQSRTFERSAPVTARTGRLSPLVHLSDSLWLLTSGSKQSDDSTLFTFNVNSRRVVGELSVKDALPVTAVARSERKVYLLTEQRGLLAIDVIDGSSEQLALPGLVYGRSMMLDRSGRLWVGSAVGLYMCRTLNTPFFSHYLPSTRPPVKPSEARSPVRALHAHGNTLEAGTERGVIYRWDARSRSFKIAEKLKRDVDDHEHYPLHGIASDKHGRFFYAASYAPGFAQTDEAVRVPLNSIERRSGYAIHADRSNSLWLGLNRSDWPSGELSASLVRLHAGTLRVINWYDLPVSKWLNAEYTFSIYEDRHGQLWAGTSSGLFKYDRASDRFSPVLHPMSDGSIKSPNNIWVIFEDSRDQLWLGSWGRGLHRFDRATDQYEDFTTEHGLPSNNIQSILEDEQGHLWIATANGLCRFDVSNRIFTNYGRDDGLLDAEFQPKAAAKLPSGEMFFGGLAGVTSFFPAALTERSQQPPLVLTGLSVSGSEQGQLRDSDTLVLHYDRNDIIFEFASLDFGFAENKRYTYLLEGLDDDWTTPSNRNSGSYNNLPPGEYLLRIKATTANGKWIARELRLHIIIPPPYWKTGWFRGLLALLVAGSIAVVALRSRHQQRELHLRLERAREKERIDLAGDIHDGPLQDLYAARFLIDDERASLSELLMRVRTDLRSISSRLQPPMLRSVMTEDLDVLVRAFGQRSTQTQFSSSAEGKPFDLPEAVSRNMFRIVRTALTNVQKHSNAKHCTVTTKYSASSVAIAIKDDGNGFDSRTLDQRTLDQRTLDQRTHDQRTLDQRTLDQRTHDQRSHDHLGIFLMRYYAYEIKAKLEIESSPGDGTVVKLSWRRDHRVLRQLRRTISRSSVHPI